MELRGKTKQLAAWKKMNLGFLPEKRGMVMKPCKDPVRMGSRFSI